jgi:hypothetical protein
VTIPRLSFTTAGERLEVGPDEAARRDLQRWGALLRDAEFELDLCESLEVAEGAVERLLEARRGALALDHLLPVVEALSAGAPLPDTADRLIEAARMFERTTTTVSRKAA